VPNDARHKLHHCQHTIFAELPKLSTVPNDARHKLHHCQHTIFAELPKLPTVPYDLVTPGFISLYLTPYLKALWRR